MPLKKAIFYKEKASTMNSYETSKSGQVVVEYVLLLIISVTMAILILNILVKRGDDPSDAGAIIQKWNSIQRQIGEDNPGKTK